MDNIRSTGTNIVIAGDFNVHHAEWLHSSKTTAAGEALEELCAAHQVTQHVDKLTRGNNTLDPILSDFVCPVTTTTHAPLGKSDHAMLISDFLTVSPRREPATVRTLWRYNRADWGRFRAFLRAADWNVIVPGDPEESCSRLTQVISAGMKKFIPNRAHHTHSSDPRWWTPECADALHAKESAWTAWRRNPGNLDIKSSYIEAVNLCAARFHRARVSFESRLSNKLTSGSLTDKGWWTTVKQAAGLSRASEIPLLVDQSKREFHSSDDKANCLARYFATKCSLGDRDISPDSLPPSAQPSHGSLDHIHFRVSDVQRRLARLNPCKATDPDGLPTRVLKESSRELAPAVTKLFELSFRCGILSCSWKLAHVLPVLKKELQI